MEKKEKNKLPQQTSTSNEIILEELRILNHGIVNADKRLEKFSRPSRVFFRGMIAGIGGAVGASLIAGIIFFILSNIFNFLNIPIEMGPLNEKYFQAQTVSMFDFK